MRKIGSGNRVKQGCWKARKRMATVCELGIWRQDLSVKSSCVGGASVANLGVRAWVAENGEKQMSCNTSRLDLPSQSSHQRLGTKNVEARGGAQTETEVVCKPQDKAGTRTVLAHENFGNRRL